MKITEADFNKESPESLQGSVFIDFRHSEYQHMAPCRVFSTIAEEIDKLLKTNGLEIVLGNVGSGDGYLVKVQKR